MKSGKKGIDLLHEPSALAFRPWGPPEWQRGLTGIASVALEDDEDDERDEMLNLCSCLDGVISQLQKRMETLDSYQPQQSAETCWADQSKIADMYDECAYVHVNKTAWC